jgi:hypothetical protein
VLLDAGHGSVLRMPDVVHGGWCPDEECEDMICTYCHEPIIHGVWVWVFTNRPRPLPPPAKHGEGPGFDPAHLICRTATLAAAQSSVVGGRK